MTREKLQSAPEYKDSTSPRVLMPPAAAPDAADAGQTKSDRHRRRPRRRPQRPAGSRRRCRHRAPRPRAAAEPSAERGLDWFNLFVANIQTGFGPFIAVYLSGQSWTQTAIGVALSIGTVSSMASQVPAGALVDAIPNKTRVAAFSVLVFTASALMFAIYPIPLFVYLAEIFTACRAARSGRRSPP